MATSRPVRSAPTTTWYPGYVTTWPSAETAAALWDPTTQLLTATMGHLDLARAWRSATLLSDGRVLMIGGLTAGTKDLLSLDGHALQSCEILERP